MAKRAKPVSALNDISQADARRYRVEEAMRTLARAEEHRKDKGLMKDVRALAKKHVQTMSKLCK